MTSIASCGPAIAERTLPELAAQPVADPHHDLALQVWRPTSTSVVVQLAGELDARTAPRLQELLAPRLRSTLEAMVLDVSGLRFLGVAGLELLDNTRRRAAGRGMVFCIVDGPVCVDRALRVAGWDATVPVYATVSSAVAELSGRIRESPVHVAS